MSIAFPAPDQSILARRDAILAGLARLVHPEALITSEDERRAFETDGLTAYRSCRSRSFSRPPRPKSRPS
jgi:glycolate oxidase